MQVLSWAPSAELVHSACYERTGQVHPGAAGVWRATNERPGMPLCSLKRGKMLSEEWRLPNPSNSVRQQATYTKEVCVSS